MHKASIQYFAFICLLFLEAFFPVKLAAETTAKAVVSSAIEEIINIIEKFPGDSNKVERQKKLRQLIEPLFDFRETAKYSLGVHWKNATEEEKEEYIKVYTDYLAKTYLSKIEIAERGMITVDSERANPSSTTVYTTVTTKKGVKAALNYKMKPSKEGWKVFDVIVEGIGLIATNRSEYAAIIRKDNIAGLIKMLKEKNSK